MMERVNNTLQNTIQALKFLPSAKKRLIEDLQEKIPANKVNSMFESISGVEILTKAELKHFLEVMYAFSKDEDFNPALIEPKPKKVKSNAGRPTVDIRAEDNPKLYYNFEAKNAFSTGYNEDGERRYTEDTRRVVMALFRKSKKWEEGFGKDLSDFEVSELSEFLRGLKAKTVKSLQDKISTIEKYIDFSIQEERTESTINSATAFDDKDKVEELLSGEDSIFTREEIFTMAMETANAQDGATLALLFEGLSRKEDFAELVNLTKSDVHFDTNRIRVGDRIIEVGGDTIKLIERALEQDTKYISVTGDKVREYKIANGSHVLRGLRGRNTITGQTVQSRLLRLSEIYDEESLNATTVAYSGQIYIATKLLNQGMDEDTVAREVMVRFNIPWNPSAHYQVKQRMERFIKRV